MKEMKGDLFSSKSSLAHSDLKMGLGIALQFKERFGRVNELKEKKGKVGDVLFLKDIFTT